jgi:hypothetical protein
MPCPQIRYVFFLFFTIVPVAKQKIQNMKAFLDNVENSHLQRDRSVGNTNTSQGNSKRPTIVGPNGHTLVLSSDGKNWVDQ